MTAHQQWLGITSPTADINSDAPHSRKGQQPHNRRLKQRIGDGISRFMGLAKIRVDHGIPS
jgi:hypothetical protein